MRYRPRVFRADSRKYSRQTKAKFDFIFADPPFNIDHGYAEHDDNLSPQDYRRFTCKWLSSSVQLMKPNGLLAVHGNDEVASLAIRYLSPKLERRHWINWHFRFGQAGAIRSATKCITSKAHLLVWAHLGASNTTFNPPVVLSDRATKYGDKRTQATETPGKRVAFDIWGVEGDGPYWGRVQGNNAERWCKATGAPCDHPNQLPEVYMQRVIETFSNPGDKMLVMFGGSGTETVVGHTLGRKVTTIEKSKICCRSIRRRLEKGSVRIEQHSAMGSRLCR